MTTISCNIFNIEQLSDFIYKVILEPKSPVDFKPGQYIEVVLNESDSRPFSIASTPKCDKLELHIGASKQNGYAMEVIQHCQNNDVIQISEAKGHAEFKPGDNPLVLIAGGTGFSYVRSIAKHLEQINYQAPVHLFWGVKNQAALYEHQELTDWADNHANFHYHPVVEEDESWEGLSGMVHLSVLETLNNPGDFNYYIAGPFPMVAAIRDLYTEKGIKLEQMHADAFAFL